MKLVLVTLLWSSVGYWVVREFLYWLEMTVILVSVDKIFNYTVEPRITYYVHQGTVKMCTHPKFVLTGVICIEKALKGTEIVYILTEKSY